MVSQSFRYVTKTLVWLHILSNLFHTQGWCPVLCYLPCRTVGMVLLIYHSLFTHQRISIIIIPHSLIFLLFLWKVWWSSMFMCIYSLIFGIFWHELSWYDIMQWTSDYSTFHLRLDGMVKGGLESFQSSDTLFE